MITMRGWRHRWGLDSYVRIAPPQQIKEMPMPRFLLLLIFFASPAMAAGPQVVVTIKPLHSLVAGVMAGSGAEPALLVDGKSSLHEFSLKPSQTSLLHKAGVVFYMGDEFEQFLGKILPQLPEGTRRVAMENAKGMTLYPVRLGDGFEEHAHHHDDEAHGDHGHDLHAWLSPANAKMMVAEIARTLAAEAPEHAELFAKNAEALEARLTALDGDLRARMAKLHGKAFAVFHDAYQYFDRAYDLQNIGSVTLHPEQPPSAKRVQELRTQIIATKALCVFREPQFDAKIVDNLMRGTGAKSAVLDPEAALLTPGADLYFQLMESIAASMETCLN